jgi:hypothetical protein
VTVVASKVQLGRRIPDPKSVMSGRAGARQPAVVVEGCSQFLVAARSQEDPAPRLPDPQLQQSGNIPA